VIAVPSRLGGLFKNSSKRLENTRASQRASRLFSSLRENYANIEEIKAMLLRDLHLLVQEGAKKPFVFWSEIYSRKRERIFHDLQTLEARLDVKTRTHLLIHALVLVLAKEEPEELELAEALAGVSQVFFHQTSLGQRELIQIFTLASQTFVQEAHVRHLFSKRRAVLKKRLSFEEQSAFDHRLFAGDGMVFCLEFYLSLYKAMQEAATAEKQWSYIHDATINLGYGKVPGLRKDILSNDPLEKFFFLILNDQIRLSLWQAFFSLREVLANKEASLEEIKRAFRFFLQTLMSAYKQIGIDRLQSELVVPYGYKPLITSIIL